MICSQDEGDRWTFFEREAPFLFEDTDRYQSPWMEERFPPALLREYLGRFGLAPFEEAFFRVDEAHPAVLLDTGERSPSLARYTVREVLDGKPWRTGA